MFDYKNIDQFCPVHYEGTYIHQDIDGAWVVSSIPYRDNWDGTFTDLRDATEFGPFEILINLKKESPKMTTYYVVRNKFTGRRSVILGPNQYIPWLLDMQAANPPKDYRFPNFGWLVRLFYKMESKYKGKWEALRAL